MYKGLFYNELNPNRGSASLGGGNTVFEDLADGETVAIITDVADTTAPTVTASPVGSEYSSIQSVTLSMNESGTIYYTTDGSTPTTSSSVYSSAITMSTTTTLKYFGVDSAGNSSSVVTQIYSINISEPDTEAPNPVTNLTVGTVASNSIPVSWTLSDSVDVEYYEVAYSTDGTNYTVSSATIPNTTTDYTVSGLSALITYTIRVVAIDTSGNRSTVVTAQGMTSEEVVGSHVDDASLTYFAENPANNTAIPNPENYFSGTGDFTLAVTFKPTVSGSNAQSNLVSRYTLGATDNVMKLEFTWNNLVTGNLYGTLSDGTTAWNPATTSSPTTYTDYNVYYHVVLQRLDTALNLYINNTLVSSATIANTSIVRSTSAQSLVIGQSGKLADFKNVLYYNRGLSEAELTQNYNALK